MVTNTQGRIFFPFHLVTNWDREVFAVFFSVLGLFPVQPYTGRHTIRGPAQCGVSYWTLHSGNILDFVCSALCLCSQGKLVLDGNMLNLFFFLIHLITCPVQVLAIWCPDHLRNLQEVVVSTLSLAHYSGSTELLRSSWGAAEGLRKSWQGWQLQVRECLLRAGDCTELHVMHI